MVDYELYKIYDKIGNVFYYCSSNFDVLLNNNLYIAKSIYRTSIEVDNYEKDSLKISADRMLAPFPEFINLNPRNTYTIQIMNKNGSTIYIGTIDNIEFDVDSDTCDITCSNITKMMENQIPKKRFTNSCNNDLFDKDCELLSDNFKRIISDLDYIILDNETIEVYNTNIVESYYTFGVLVINNQNNLIMKHTYDSVNNIHIFKTFYKIIDIDNYNGDIIVYPGCDKRYETCKNKFNNNLNFNGFPSIPNEDIFYKFSK